MVHLPSLRGALRHSLPALVESSIAPALVFYVVLWASGFRGALVAALLWSYAAVVRRLVRQQRIPALLSLGLVILTARSAVSFFSGSAFLYFVQPTAGTVLVALTFLGTALANRPLVAHLARDFCPLDDAFVAHPAVRSFFLRISFLWAVVLLVNAGLVFWLLLDTSLRAFVIERMLVTWLVIGVGIALSVLWFVRTMRTAGFRVRFGLALAGPAPDGGRE